MRSIYTAFASSNSGVISFQNDDHFGFLVSHLGNQCCSAWQNMEVSVERNVPDDFLYLPRIPVFTQDAWGKISDHIKDSAEGLKLFTKNHEIFYVMNVFDEISGAIDLERSSVMKDKDGLVTDIFSYSFVYEKIQDKYVFRIPENNEDLFFTEKFKTLVNDTNIKNINFQKVPTR